MQIYLFTAALIAIMAVIFALQNAIPITVSFLIWKVESSLALILIIAFVAGLITSFLFNAISRLRKTTTIPIFKKNDENTITKKSSNDNEKE
ncbi:MAG: LapA family protein [Atribacterota bacterium]|nr:LapA family protein [Atribacterota bacterium]